MLTKTTRLWVRGWRDSLWLIRTVVFHIQESPFFDGFPYKIWVSKMDVVLLDSVQLVLTQNVGIVQDYMCALEKWDNSLCISKNKMQACIISICTFHNWKSCFNVVEIFLQILNTLVNNTCSYIKKLTSFLSLGFVVLGYKSLVLIMLDKSSSTELLPS
jgi:hypothetical protein